MSKHELHSGHGGHGEQVSVTSTICALLRIFTSIPAYMEGFEQLDKIAVEGQHGSHGH